MNLKLTVNIIKILFYFTIFFFLLNSIFQLQKSRNFLKKYSFENSNKYFVNNSSDINLEKNTLNESIYTQSSENFEKWLNLIRKRFESRNTRLSNECKKYNSNLIYSSENTIKTHMFVNKEHSLLVCLTAKVNIFNL